MHGVIEALGATLVVSATLAFFGQLFIRGRPMRVALAAIAIPVAVLLAVMLIGSATPDPEWLRFALLVTAWALVPAFVGSLVGTGAGALVKLAARRLRRP